MTLSRMPCPFVYNWLLAEMLVTASSLSGEYMSVGRHVFFCKLVGVIHQIDMDLHCWVTKLTIDLYCGTFCFSNMWYCMFLYIVIFFYLFCE